MHSLLLILALVMAPAGRYHRQEPHIISQRTDMVTHKYESATWERTIMLRNPLDKAAWVWIECESHLTTVAIGVRSHHTEEVVLPGIPPDEQCMLNHWILQKKGVTPPEWRP